jgi:hypothetical protein
MITKEDVAAKGVLAQGGIDRHLTAALKSAKLNIDVTAKGVELGMVRALQGKKMIARARRIYGAIAEAAELAAELHIEQQQACAANGVDTGDLTSVGGVALGVVHTDGGGR